LFEAFIFYYDITGARGREMTGQSPLPLPLVGGRGKG